MSGIRFAFDPTQAPGSRVVPGSVEVGGEPVEAQRRYSLATKQYLAEGKDGKLLTGVCVCGGGGEGGRGAPSRCLGMLNHTDISPVGAALCRCCRVLGPAGRPAAVRRRLHPAAAHRHHEPLFAAAYRQPIREGPPRVHGPFCTLLLQCPHRTSAWPG